MAGGSTIRGSTILGLTLGDRSAVLAQVATERAGRSTTSLVQRVARFDAPGDAKVLDKPADGGAAFATFLAGHGFTAKRVVVGVPARWLIAQERDMPPTDPSAAAGVLRLAAERLSLAESGTLVADYAGETDAKAASRVLLVGMLKPQLDRVRQFVEAAGLTLVAVCPTSLAVARAAGGDRSVLRLTDEGAELVLQSAGNPRLLQPLTTDLATLGPELRRTLTMRGAGQTPLLLADGVGLSETQQADLFGRLAGERQCLGPGTGLAVTVDAGARNGSAAALSADAPWPAVALALAAGEKRGLPVDFADSKLTLRPPSRFGRRTIGIAAIVLAGAVGFGYLMTTVTQREAEAARLKSQLDLLVTAPAGQKSVVAVARDVIDQVNYGRTYIETRPPALDCMKQVTLAFNYDEPIWATQVSYRNTGQGQLLGKSVDDRKDQKLILALLDRLKGNPSLKDVQLQNVSESGGKEQLKSFSISFTFLPTAVAASAGAPSGVATTAEAK